MAGSTVASLIKCEEGYDMSWADMFRLSSTIFHQKAVHSHVNAICPSNTRLNRWSHRAKQILLHDCQFYICIKYSKSIGVRFSYIPNSTLSETLGCWSQQIVPHHMLVCWSCMPFQEETDSTSTLTQCHLHIRYVVANERAAWAEHESLGTIIRGCNKPYSQRGYCAGVQ